jgi:hypothetical protein
MKIPKIPFKAICIKSFNTAPASDGKFVAWGCLELLRIYEFNIYEEDMNRFRITVKVVARESGYRVGLYEAGFNVITEKGEETVSVPYFFDYFRILKE